ncbi:MAG: chromosomal replication initiator protein DnaA, partial [Parcubacteria group bacterium]|nr:chromosomal replication initiator protein DnaA [Parcubacteria group bacterium]
IDDIQFFAGKLKIQEEFFHVFNTLYDRNSQIIFSSDKPPKHIDGLEDRLRSRFEGGMIVDISEPEYESRLAILKYKAEQRSFSPAHEILQLIAETIKDNVRELEGALTSIIAQSKIKGRPLSLAESRETLKKNARPYKNISVAQVVKIIADFYSLDERVLFEKTRRKEIVRPRQIAMFIMRRELDFSFPSIGQKFGQRDHTTVIYACRKIDSEMEKDKRLGQEVEQIKTLLGNVRG